LKLNKDQVKDLSIFAAASPKANISAPNYVNRLTYIINKTPEVAKSYFEGQNKYTKETLEKSEGKTLQDMYKNLQKAISKQSK